MRFTIDVDTGGTFTDGLFSNGKEVKRAKVDTTPHDLTLSWLNCMREGAQKFGFSSLQEFLEQVDIIRWSSTVASNVVAERKGPKLGLFVTDGHQEDLYSSGSPSSAFGHLIEKSNVEAVKLPLNTDELLIQLKNLLEKGVRRICISMQDGLKNRQTEMKIKEVFDEQYPDHYLGNVPLLLGSDICKHPDDMTRTYVALLNSYVHGPMAHAMFKAEDDLREQGFLKTLLLGHTDGGVARVSKTKPFDTIESGPIFGIHAGAYWANVYKFPHVITLDVGGTTTKIGLIEGFRPALRRDPEIFGIPLKQTMVDLTSIPLGGGTVAKVTKNSLHLGPESMGAYPGPAGYDLGGAEATLTDAYFINGFLDPLYFSGGTKKINAKQAEKAILDRVAAPLKVDVHMAAYMIATKATDIIATEVTELIKRTGRSPGDFVLFAFGGNGAIVGCEVAKKAALKKVYAFSLGSVFSAFGSSVADISHNYEYSPMIAISEKKSLAEIVQWMTDEARRDMEGEGFGAGNVDFELEMFLHRKKDTRGPVSVVSPLSATGALQGTAAAMLDDWLQRSGLGLEGPDLLVELLRLRARVPAPKFQPPQFAKAGESPRDALKGERVGSRGTERIPVKIYDWDKLRTGNIIQGPCIIEGSDMTYILPRSWHLTMDSFQNAVLDRRI